jgi:hypothetical protein
VIAAQQLVRHPKSVPEVFPSIGGCNGYSAHPALVSLALRRSYINWNRRGDDMSSRAYHDKG